MKKLALCMIAAATFAHATTNFSAPTATPGTQYNALDVTGFSTSGNDMAGMLVTGTFFGGGTAVCTWAATSGTAGGCTALNGTKGFQLAEDGDTYGTFNNPFNLTHIIGAALASLSFDGPSGFTMFDRTFGNATGTDGSNVGSDASGSNSSSNPNSIATSVLYTNLVGTQGNAPVGDEYATVVLTFGGTGLAIGSTASWTMDTDSIGLRNGAPGSGTPEPGTLGLVGGSLGALVMLARRKRRTA